MRIWKWTLQVKPRQEIRIPVGAQILTVQMQGDSPQLWAVVDENAPKEIKELAIYGTGNPIPDEGAGKYVATFQTYNGRYVWHIFDLGVKAEAVSASSVLSAPAGDW